MRMLRQATYLVSFGVGGQAVEVAAALVGGRRWRGPGSSKGMPGRLGAAEGCGRQGRGGLYPPCRLLHRIEGVAQTMCAPAVSPQH